MPESGTKFFLRNKAIIILCSVIFICFVLLPVYFLFQLDIAQSKVILLLLFAPVIGLLYLAMYTSPVFLLALISKKERRENSEIEELENAYNASSRKLLIHKLGLMNYFKMTGGINRGLDTGFEFCKALLDHAHIRSDQDLKYHVIIRLYKASIMSENYSGAVEYLQSASELKPNDLLTSFWLAEAYEFAGDAEKAISIYQRLAIHQNISIRLKRYLFEQAERVKTKGVKTPPPISGLRYMTW